MLRIAKILVLLSVVLVVLSGCSLVVTGSEGGPSEPIVEEEPAVQPDDLRPIEVQAVNIEVGVGSPIPVDVFVSGGWPGLCAQLAEISMTPGDFRFDYMLLATPEEPDCPPDQIGLPFRIAIPINIVELPEGTYTVSVNGVETTFDVPVAQPAAP